MSVAELVRAKNMDLLMHKHNSEVLAIERHGGLVDESKLRSLKHNYENLMARLDTDKNTSKKNGKYAYGIKIDTHKLLGVENNPTINIRRNHG